MDGKLIEELKMTGRWLREALGRHFDGSWEASRDYDAVRGNMKIGSGRPKSAQMLPQDAQMAPQRSQNGQK